MGYLTLNMKHRTCRNGHVTCDVYHVTCNIGHITWDMYDVTIDILHVTFNKQILTCVQLVSDSNQMRWYALCIFPNSLSLGLQQIRAQPGAALQTPLQLIHPFINSFIHYITPFETCVYSAAKPKWLERVHLVIKQTILQRLRAFLISKDIKITFWVQKVSLMSQLVMFGCCATGLVEMGPNWSALIQNGPNSSKVVFFCI